ncbi:MAG TPA: CotH kinase family protein, partial [Pirellulaceae bacterium]
MSYRLFELAGIPSPRTHYVHFRVVDEAGETGGTQYIGDLWGLYLAVEQPDGSFLDDRGLPDGNVYKIEGSNGDKKHQGKTQPLDTSDWNAFRGSSASTQNEAYWRANMNLFSYYTFRAANRILGNVDVREGYNHYFYNNPVGGWTVMPWDCDMMFIAETHWSGTIQQKACLNVPVLALEYANRAREMLDLVCSDPSPAGGQIAQLIDEYAQLVNPAGQPLTWSDLDHYLWNYHPRTNGDPNNHSGQGNHKGNFFYTPFTDSRIGGDYVRTLVSSDHEGSMTYLRNYATNPYTGGGWAQGNGQQNGYGYEFL